MRLAFARSARPVLPAGQRAWALSSHDGRAHLPGNTLNRPGRHSELYCDLAHAHIALLQGRTDAGLGLRPDPGPVAARTNGVHWLMLQSTEPADLPVAQSTKFELVINAACDGSEKPDTYWSAARALKGESLQPQHRLCQEPPRMPAQRATTFVHFVLIVTFLSRAF
jgi:hypothetical protein